jgi:hypothetical protein
MTKHLPLPTDPVERRREKYRRRMLCIGASQKRRYARLVVDLANRDLVGGVLPPAIAKRVRLPKDPTERAAEVRRRTAQRVRAHRSYVKRLEALRDAAKIVVVR